jgi:nitroimidazol reductase NimA-like FMN-containing flavoprotein (pyridoxamine 5'-phosphate oxidase superfamily)
LTDAMNAREPVLEEIGDSECRQLLAAHEVGRLVVVLDDAPHVFPVNYAFDGDGIVVRTDLGTKLHGATLRRVAFEIDELGQAPATSSWSVVAHGVGDDITDALDPASEHARTLLVTPWAPGGKQQWIRISALVFTGRRLVA